MHSDDNMAATSNRTVHGARAYTMQLGDGKYVGYVEHHRPRNDREPETKSQVAGKFDTEAEAFYAALKLAREFDGPRQHAPSFIQRITAAWRRLCRRD